MMKSRGFSHLAFALVLIFSLVFFFTGCGQNRANSVVLSPANTAVIVNTHEVAANKNADSAVVSANEDQIALWNEFVQNRENNDLPAVVLYTRKQQPVKSLNEISDKKQFAICEYYTDYSDLVLQLFGYKTDDLIEISIRGGAQGTLDDPELRIYLGYNEWKEELSTYGWIPVRLIAE